MEWLRLGEFVLSIGSIRRSGGVMLSSWASSAYACMCSRSGICPTKTTPGALLGWLSIFMFSMIGIVLGDNLFMMFIFWELVGSAPGAPSITISTVNPRRRGEKAFITNRVGDFGFLLGIVLVLCPIRPTNSTSSRRPWGHDRRGGGERNSPAAILRRASASRRAPAARVAPGRHGKARRRCRALSTPRRWWRGYLHALPDQRAHDGGRAFRNHVGRSGDARFTRRSVRLPE